jgi:hypothetical protein
MNQAKFETYVCTEYFIDSNGTRVGYYFMDDRSKYSTKFYDCLSYLNNDEIYMELQNICNIYGYKIEKLYNSMRPQDWIITKND